MKQEPPVLVDDAKAGRGIFENLADLALLLGNLRLALLERRDVVDPEDALAAGEADVTAMVGDLHVRQEDMDRPAVLRLPDHLLVQKLPAAFPQPSDDLGPLIEMLPEPARVEEV